MARRGSTSIANRLSRAGAVITGTPFTFAAWYKAITLPSVDANAGHAILTITDTATDNHFFALFGRVADDLFFFTASSVLGQEDAVSTTVITVGTWFHVCGVAASATDRRIFVDGVDEGQNTVNIIPVGLDQTQMFRTQTDTGAFSPANADLAEAGIWNVALTADEVAALAVPGALPSEVRPLSLKMYLDLMLALSPEPDRSSNGNVLFVTGSLPQSDHVPVPTVITPGSASLTITAFAPTVALPIGVNPGAASLTITTFAPTIGVTDLQTVSPPPASLALTASAPTVALTDDITITPGAAALILSAFAPTVQVIGNIFVAPGTAALTLTGFAPTFTLVVVAVPPIKGGVAAPVARFTGGVALPVARFTGGVAAPDPT